MSQFFSGLGYQTQVYSDGLKAYEELANARVPCDVIITDLGLPGISGIEFTKRMKELGSQIPIILITANRKVEVAVEAIRSGAYDFVVKPVHFPQLLVSVERALHLLRVEQDVEILKNVVQLQEGLTNVEGVIGKSSGMKHALDLARRVASSSASVLISGESGTGKEVIAKAIHSLGMRRKLPFIAINCAAIPENLLESELFGHAKGSFTGASEKKVGLFEEAEAGTLFLDEIGDLNLPLQAKLLRVLQERKIRRIGENQDRPIRARIISATHRNLREEVEKKTFREDLFFRLNVIPIWIPPLRERQEDIVPLAEFFLKKYSALNDLRNKRFSKECLETLIQHSWRGNVRELENSIERALVLSESDVIGSTDVVSVDLSDARLGAGLGVPQSQRFPAFSFQDMSKSQVLSIEELTNRYVCYVLELNSGAKDKTAKDLHIDRKTLYRRLREIEMPQGQPKKDFHHVLSEP